MLTVKYIEATGVEHIMLAQSVTFEPMHVETTDQVHPQVTAYGVHPSAVPSVDGKFIGAGSDGVLKLKDGHVYVMNEAGQTVGSYELEERRRARGANSGRATT